MQEGFPEFSGREENKSLGFSPDPIGGPAYISFFSLSLVDPLWARSSGVEEKLWTAATRRQPGRAHWCKAPQDRPPGDAAPRPPLPLRSARHVRRTRRGELLAFTY